MDFGEGLAKTFVRVKDAGGRTALHFAAAGGKTHVCKYLVQDLGLDANLKDRKGETPLNCATRGQQNQTVAWLAANGGNPNLGNDKGFCALHYAATNGLKDLMQLLISKGAVIEAESDGGTPLHCAAALGRKEAVKILLDREANPNKVSGIYTPLMNSISARSFECVNLLLKAGADPNLGWKGQTPLCNASVQGETDIIKCLLKAGANPNVADIFWLLQDGLTPLEIVGMHSNLAGVMILFPVTSRIPTIPNWSLDGIMKHLHSEEGRRQILSILIFETKWNGLKMFETVVCELNAEIHASLFNWGLKKKETFLLAKSRGEEAFRRKDYMDATYWYSLAIDSSLYDATVFSNRSLCWARLNDGSRALSDAEACVALRPDWGKAHYRVGVAWKLLGVRKFSEIISLEWKLSKPSLECLYLRESELYAWNFESPRHRLLQAASDGKLKLLKALGEELDFGEGLAKMFVQVKDAGGRTALHFAAAEGKTHVCKYLVQDLGLDANLKDRKGGDTPLNHATLGQQNQTVAWLAANGANPNLGNAEGFCALHYAAEKGLKDLMRLLISKGAEIEAESHAGTPLQCAAAHGRKEAVKMLLDRKANQAGADPNLDSNGLNPLHYAAAEGESEIIKCMLKAGANPNVTETSRKAIQQSLLLKSGGPVCFNCYSLLQDGLTPLEIAALHSDHAAVMVLLPVTSRIPTYPDWSLVGIMKYVHSDEGRRQRELKKMEMFLLSKSRGEEAFKRKDYVDAIYWYSQAIIASPCDATVFSNRSLCWARLNEGSRALTDAEACVALRPDWGKAHYREGVAWKLLGNLPMAAEAFAEGLKVDPENKELKVALRDAVEAEFGIPVSLGIRIIRME
ncbi:hypothetical protein C3L33_04161, partial [Rhododendron williamsianum]